MILICIAAFALTVQCSSSEVIFKQLELGLRNIQIIDDGEYRFKDLNKNGMLDPYEDWRLTDNERIDNLVSLMTLEEKIGMMFHPNIAVTEDGKIKYDLTDEEKKALENVEQEAYAGPIGPGGQNQQEGAPAAILPGQMRRTATAKDHILDKNFRNILNNGVAKSGVPTILAMNLNGSLVVLPKDLMEVSDAAFMIFDVLDNALLDVVFGKYNPTGKLPFDIPSSMEAVRNQKEDVPFDTKDPIFKYDFGLSYNY